MCDDRVEVENPGLLPFGLIVKVVSSPTDPKRIYLFTALIVARIFTAKGGRAVALGECIEGIMRSRRQLLVQKTGWGKRMVCFISGMMGRSMVC